MLSLQEIQLPKVLTDIAKDLIKNKEGIGFVAFGIGMMMKMANFNAQLDLKTGKIVWPDMEILKNRLRLDEAIANVPKTKTKKSAPGIAGPGYPDYPE